MRFKRIYFLLLLIPLYAAADLQYREPWGKDSDLHTKSYTHSPLKKKSSLAVYLATQVILFHQRIISPVDGPRSHFRPTSSRYMQLAMQKHGFMKGFIMGCDRLLRENKDPWMYRSIEIDGKLYKYDPPH